MSHLDLEELGACDVLAYIVLRGGIRKAKLTIERRTCPIYLARAVLCIHVLPYRPYAINLCMVQIERRITGAGKGVHVYTAHDEVPSGMDTIVCLEISTEAAKVITAIDETGHVCRLGVLAPDWGDVPG